MCPHIADECRFLLISQHLYRNPLENIASGFSPYSPSNAQHVLLIFLGWFVRWELIGLTTPVFIECCFQKEMFFFCFVSFLEVGVTLFIATFQYAN